ncbi:hypothetical protein PF010_g12763 [Phytophthora fragariae]|uniref:RxLR effector protein n=1 Tax=Phytophthora fragariae TaxID=53985 RepID=A0A6A3KIU0_9STRA|nr:hypothetical protein PF011_g11470 [Phytophthora fragariae]KAE9106061.1 hypothetical protein PF010_g12763 [Phytophthora fragariae]KAE9227061.1 hypothetical protein PF004_g11467 [Phytophthora fragariae]
MFSSLTARYGDEAAANMIAVAKEKGTLETKAIAAKLYSQQVLTWFADAKSADDVFNLLKLDEAQGPILEKPALKTWIYYATSMGEDPYKIMLSKLNSRYGDDGLAQILVPAKRDKTTKDVAGKLDDLLLKSWQEEKHSADYVFKLLKLDRHEGNVFYTPEFTTWRSFLARLDSKNPDEAMYLLLKARYGDGGLKDMMNNADESAETMLVLMKETSKEELGFTEKLSKMAQLQNDAGTTRVVLARLREEIWRSEGKTADDVFKMLKLNDDLDTVYAAFRKPALGTWASYVTKLHNVDKKNPDVISILEERFSRWPLASVLITSKTSAAENLRTLQFKKFVSEGIHPDTIMSRMGGFDDAYLVRWGYRKYYESNRAK